MALKDYAISTVVTAPSPATSGTTLTVTTGHGTRFGAVPFYATLVPEGQLPTLDNAEKVKVTAISTDTLTIVRAQDGTTAKSVAAGWLVVGAVFQKDVTPTEVAVTTAAATATKVGTTAAGNYTPEYGDRINVAFSLGCNVSTPTLNIDGSGAKNIRLGVTNITTSLLGIAAAVTIPMWYDGTYWQIYGSFHNTDTNTTYKSPQNFTSVTGTTQAAAVNMGYLANNAAQVNVTLPATAGIGDIVEVIGVAAGGYRVTAPAGDNIILENNSTASGRYIYGARNTNVALRCIVANTTWEVVNYTGAIYTDGGYVTDKSSSSWNFNETPSGTIDGTNVTFTLVAAPQNLILTLNGIWQKPGAGNDYTLSGNTITFLTAPVSGSNILATYTTGVGTVFLNGSNGIVQNGIVSGTQDGTNKIFTTGAYIGGSLEVYVNGVRQKLTTHYVETTPASGVFTLDDAPLSTDIITTSYQIVSSVTGNADTVDGIHASSTPTPNQLLPLDSNAKLPDAAVPIPSSYYLAQNGTQNITSAAETAITGLSQTVTESGKYLISLTGNLQIYSAPANPRIGIYVNGTRVAYSAPSTNHNFQQSYGVSIQRTLAASDVVSARVINGACQLYEGQHLTITGIR